MSLITALSLLLTLAYAALMLNYLRGWRALPQWELPDDFLPTTPVSVLIAARNEAPHIEACLHSIVEGSYPADLLEVIIIDDYSDDGTVAAVRRTQAQLSENSPRITLLQLADFLPPESRFSANKKKAVEIGVAHATGELIVATDADCIAPVDWLRLVVSRFGLGPSPASTPPPAPPPKGRGDVERTATSSRTPLPFEGGAGGEAGEGPRLLTAPVAFHGEQSLLQRFQSLDFLGLMGITGAGIQLGFQRMGNGANLAYPKAVFEAVGGYSGNENLASGDDMFLVQKVAARWPGSVFFLKNPAATVLTEAPSDWRSFLRQRLRWGTKNATLPEWPVRLILLAVFLFCWSILINSVLTVLAIVGVPANGPSSLLSASSVLLSQLVVKAVFDYVFLREMCRFFGRTDLLRWFAPSFLLHTLYVALVGAASFFLKKYGWKGRRAK